MQFLSQTGTGWRWLIATLYTLFITVILLQQEAQPLIPTGIPPAPPSVGRELLFGGAHVAGFALLTWLWLWTLSAHMSVSSAGVRVALCVAVYALATEYAQSFVPGRAVQVLDVAANGSGLLIGLWAGYRHHHDPDTSSDRS